MLRNHITPNEREVKQKKYKFARGTTAFTKESVRKFVVAEHITEVGAAATAAAAAESMDIV